MSEESQIRAATELQEALNRQLLSLAELREQYKPPPMRRQRKAKLKWTLFKYRTSSRWRRVRVAVALRIAPELEDG